MNLTVHVAAGVVVAQYTANPVLAFFYGLLSHIILDIVPHGDSAIYLKYKNKELSLRKAAAKAITDAILAIVLTIIFFNVPLPSSNLVLGMTVIGAIIPDILIGLYELSQPRAPKWLKIIHKWHFKNHDLIAKKFDLSVKQGLFFQAIILLILIQKIF